MKITIKTKIIILCGLFLALFIPLSIFLLSGMDDIVNIFKETTHHSEDVAKIQELRQLIVDMETGQRGFVITGKEEFLEPYHNAKQKFRFVLKDLREHFSSHPEYLAYLEQIDHLHGKWSGIAGDPEIEARRLITQSETSLKSITLMVTEGKGKQIVDKARVIIERMTNDFEKKSNKDAMILITQMSKDILDSETGFRGFLLTGKDWFLEPFHQGQINFGNHIKKIRKVIRNKKNLKNISDIEILYKEWLAKVAEPQINARIAYEKNPTSLNDLAKVLAEGTGKAIMDEFRKVTSKFIDELNKDISEKLSRSDNRVAFTNLLSRLISIIGVLVILFLAFFIGRSIINPIKVLIDGTTIIGRGDFSHKIKLKDSEDELSTLAHSFNQMSHQLRLSMEIEKKKAEEIQEAHNKLQDTQSQLIQSAKLASLGELSAGLAHELNNPLNIIMGFNQNIEAYFESHEQVTLPEVENDISKINKNCQKMRDIIQHFRVFSRQDKPIFREVRVSEIIDDSFLLFNEQLRLHGIDVDLNMTKDDLTVYGDKVRLEQVLTNLISNSRDAISSVFPKKGGMLKVSSKVEDNFVLLDFTDNGGGIDKSKIDQIFDPFFTTKEVGKGTGLGLSISYGILKEHKGDISCLATSDAGTTFRIKLPLSTSTKKSTDLLIKEC